jgi:phage baseplate assembly protein W
MARRLSIEDRNLSAVTIIGTRQKLYQDIDITFLAKASGEIFKKTEANAVKQAVKNLILTNHYEKPFNAKFGGNIQGLLFELADDETGEQVRDTIIATINENEPRAKIISVDVNSQPDSNAIEATITFKVVNSGEIVTFTTILKRLR